jgi:hypothetical protein
VSLASVIGGANPDASQWPFATLNNFENIANNLIDTSKGCNMVFAPLVQPDQLQDFENFAYDYYEHSRMPEPFPNGTALTASFGKGVWAMDADQNQYHDTQGTTGWGSPNELLAPMFHHSGGAISKLLMNLHFHPMMGKMIDDMIICAQDKASVGASLDECVAISPMVPEKTSWVQNVESGPGSTILQPVYPANDPTKVSLCFLSSTWYTLCYYLSHFFS